MDKPRSNTRSASHGRHFYKPAPLRSLGEIKAGRDALQDDAKGLLDEIVSPGATT